MIHLTSFTILVILQVLRGLVSISKASCPQSTLSVVSVESCPLTDDEWRDAAARKGCRNITHVCASFEYHCVINAWQNATVEVCAPSQQIIGNVCAEFNFGGNRIQRSEHTQCEKCPEVYNSKDAFRYPECYNYVRSTEKIENSQSTTLYVSISSHGEIKENESSHEETNKSMVIGLSVTAVFVLISLTIFIVLLLAGRRQTTKNLQTQGVRSSLTSSFPFHCIPTCVNISRETEPSRPRVNASSGSDAERNLMSAEA